MFDWPKLELTDYERKWCAPYKTKTHAGVLRRTYERTIYYSGEQGPPNAQLQIARRSRVFALSFSGALSTTRLQITNASGTLYNVRDARTGNYPIITSMLGGSFALAESWVSRSYPPTLFADLAATNYSILAGGNSTLLIDPNWVLTPNETLIFNGSWDDITIDPDTELSQIVNICVHVWEFPGMGNADKAVREIV